MAGPRCTLELLSFRDTLVLAHSAAAVDLFCPVLSSCPAVIGSHLLHRVRRPGGSAHFRDVQTESCPGDFALIVLWMKWASKVFPRPAVSFGPKELESLMC